MKHSEGVTVKQMYYTTDWSLDKMWDFATHPYMENIVRYIEPRLLRGMYLPCWLWTGRSQYFNRGKVNEYSYPTIYMPIQTLNPKAGRKLTYVHRYMAETFWDFPKEYVVKRDCRYSNCVNPQHFIIARRNNRGV